VHQSLRGYTTAVLADVARDALGEQIAEDINAVAHLVSRTNDLAVALTDFAVPTSARKGVLQDLLIPRVHALALKVVLRAVATERVEEFPTVLHELYEFARHMHDLDPDELRAEEPIVSRTPWREYVAGYSDAVFEGVAETSELEEIEDELFRFARVIESSPSLRTVLSDVTVPLESRDRILNDLLQGKVHPATLVLVHVTMQGRFRDLVASLDWLVEQAARARGWRVARVYAGLPIDADEQGLLASALERITSRPVELQILPAPDILGGAVIQIGDLLVDASAQRKLEQLEEHLLSHEGATRGAHT
jgi:F-type H+-transporting ATPase subunit delta